MSTPGRGECTETGCQSPKGRGGAANGGGGLFHGDVMFWNQTEMVAAQRCGCAKRPQIVHFKTGDFVLCELHLREDTLRALWLGERGAPRDL